MLTGRNIPWPTIVLGVVVAAVIGFVTCTPDRLPDYSPDRSPVGDTALELQPGLSAVYRTLASAGTSIARIDAKPVLAITAGSPHPRIPVGPFHVTWSGTIRIDAGEEELRFGAFVRGRLSLSIDGICLLQGEGAENDSWIEADQSVHKKPGTYPLVIEFEALSDGVARLQIHWEGKTFTREPLPAWRLQHAPAELPAVFRAEAQIDAGRQAVRQLGCAMCHTTAFPAISATVPGPSLAGLRQRVRRDWLVQWLDKPNALQHDAHMPALFPAGREGFVERWIVAEHLIGATRAEPQPQTGSFRAGRQAFVGMGCAACHEVPDLPRDDLLPDDRTPRLPFVALGDRMTGASLAAFLVDPSSRYPDGRMPKLPITSNQARDIAAYLLKWSPSSEMPTAATDPVTTAEITATATRLGVTGISATGRALVRQRACAACHTGMGETGAEVDVPITQFEIGASHPRYDLDPATHQTIAAYAAVAKSELHHSPTDTRRTLLQQHGCVRCHQRDTDRSSPLERIGNQLETPMLYRLPFQRTPSLTNALGKFRREYLLAAVRDGVEGVRPAWYSYRMPTYGTAAAEIVKALAEADGVLLTDSALVTATPTDPTLHTHGPELVGFRGYACIACHIFNGRAVTQQDPGLAAADLTTMTRRLRRDWFDRWLDCPQRVRPDSPMPVLFQKDKKVGDKDILWAYFAKGKDAAPPKPLPPTAVTLPPANGPPLIAQIPIHLPDQTVLESICVLTACYDALVYDVGAGKLHSVYTGAQILRDPNGGRRFRLVGTELDLGPLAGESSGSTEFEGYDRLRHGVRLRYAGGHTQTLLFRDRSLNCRTSKLELPPATAPEAVTAIERGPARWADGTAPASSLERPGFRATRFPIPATVSGEDLVMPGALTVDPRTGRLFIASMKLGEIFVLEGERFVDYAGGLFQEAFSMKHEGDALYVLHRKNLTRIQDTDSDGIADRFDRLATFPHAVADKYDWGYGLVRDRTGKFLVSFAPHANHHLPGSGSILRLTDSGHEEVAFGLRNPIGWCNGPDGEAFFTDNQGEWVATNKLCHVVSGRFYGYPNHKQRQHVDKQRGDTALWIPYEWARSINGVAYDSAGKFGPFAGQFFLAELMYDGAIIRANLEKIRGTWQGACFPFWGKGLLGPLALTFDHNGSLYVGAITMPGWMGQPDRGALFRIDPTDQVPFEIQSIHVLPRGFRMVFTTAIDAATAAQLDSYDVERYHYEYTGAYGSPELDRTSVAVESVVLRADGRSVDLTTAALLTDWVYAIAARGVRSVDGTALLHPLGAYTLNEIPDSR